MSQLLTQFKLDYGKYFDQPPDPRESTPSTADPDNIFNKQILLHLFIVF